MRPCVAVLEKPGDSRGYRGTEIAEKVRHTTTQQRNNHINTLTYEQLHKMTSWNKQGWANENIINHPCMQHKHTTQHLHCDNKQLSPRHNACMHTQK